MHVSKPKRPHRKVSDSSRIKDDSAEAAVRTDRPGDEAQTQASKKAHHAKVSHFAPKQTAKSAAIKRADTVADAYLKVLGSHSGDPLYR